MTKENKMKAIELLMNQNCTIEMCAVIDGRVHDDCIALTDSCHNAIKTLIDNGYSVSIQEGKMLVNKYI